MHRYIAVHDAADQIHWGENFRLKGVDVATYMYQIKRFLERAARALGDEDSGDRWARSAEHTAEAVECDIGFYRRRMEAGDMAASRPRQRQRRLHGRVQRRIVLDVEQDRAHDASPSRPF